MIALFLGIFVILNTACSNDSIEKQYEAPADYYMLYDLNETLKEEDFIVGHMEDDGVRLLNKELEEYKVIPVEDKNILKKVVHIRKEQGTIFYTYYSFVDIEEGIAFFNETPEYIHPGDSYSLIKDNCYRYRFRQGVFEHKKGIDKDLLTAFMKDRIEDGRCESGSFGCVATEAEITYPDTPEVFDNLFNKLYKESLVAKAVLMDCFHNEGSIYLSDSHFNKEDVVEFFKKICDSKSVKLNVRVN